MNPHRNNRRKNRRIWRFTFGNGVLGPWPFHPQRPKKCGFPPFHCRPHPWPRTGPPAVVLGRRTKSSQNGAPATAVSRVSRPGLWGPSQAVPAGLVVLNVDQHHLLLRGEVCAPGGGWGRRARQAQFTHGGKAAICVHAKLSRIGQLMWTYQI